ncbi:MAG: fumarylacetoacetate hydrolase family protein [Rhizobiaceae bacterium]|nr:fumarylacetoacetate hydrolase family protein [Rhizobiaceae bacterium]
MKLATYLHNGAARIGVVDDAASTVFDLRGAADREGIESGTFASMLALIDAGEGGLEAARTLLRGRGTEEDLRVPLSSLVLLAPIPEPRQMRDFSVFPGHIAGAYAAMQRFAGELAGRPPASNGDAVVPQIFRDQPIYYKCNRFSVVGHDHAVIRPRYSSYLDYELELAAIIGRRGKDIKAKAAGDFIFGYTIFNDFSARDAQLAESRAKMGPAKGKDFDTGNVLGPWIVTADEIGDPYNLAMEARVNGTVLSRGSSAGMLHSFEEMIAAVSRDETLHPGEVFGSGTIAGGSGLEQGRFLAHDDRVELEVERIGFLRNRIVAQDT